LNSELKRTLTCWIRLKDFVKDKRKYSIGRDYAFFEWLASKSIEFHDEKFKTFENHFYKYETTGFDYLERDLIKTYRWEFSSAKDIEAAFINPTVNFTKGSPGE